MLFLKETGVLTSIEANWMGEKLRSSGNSLDTTVLSPGQVQGGGQKFFVRLEEKVKMGRHQCSYRSHDMGKRICRWSKEIALFFRLMT